ncbi:uncharacterized protein ALTATR162_LOCUS10976 [Alternaria atra]|uniref:NACHT domain-containing protein n=1 Tax=Alternaria atra TaxID=119953 RepID=A0A8J2N6U1_9PLEO|nr:uncharacterized protein ALTATR162_LOCUS10976 [Alternaria atra]CAG5184572.1 unnamed protein product [Alternaria atra]
MPDVLGAVTGVIGACDVIARATLKSLEYISEVKAAPKHLERLKDELETLESVTSALRGFLKSARVARIGFTESCPIFIFVDKCKDHVVELEQYFAEKKTQSRLLWPLDAKPGLEKRLEGIQKFVNLFHLALSVNGWSYFCKEAEEAGKMLKQELDEWKEVRKTLQPLNNMSEDLQHIRSHCRVIEAGLELLRDSTAPKLEEIKVHLQAHLDKESMEERKRSHNELLNWLSADDLLVKHRQVLGTRQKGTGGWSEQMLRETDWLYKQSSRTLWCHGIPGCGKTVIFSTILEHIKAQSDPKCTLVAAIYLDYKDQRFHDLRSVLAALTRQLIESSLDAERLVELVRPTKDTCTVRGQSAPNVSDLDGLLLCIEDLGYSFILCFDALDEISEPVQHELLSWLSCTSAHRSLKTLLMSRSNIKVRPWGSIFLEHRIIATVEDLRTYLEARVSDTKSEDLREILARRPLIKEEIVSKIISRSDGMFLLASLHFTSLEDALSEREVRDLLHGTSDQVIDHYDVYLRRIQSQRQSQLALKAISWVHLARRPLTAPELLEAIAIRAHDTDLDRTGMITIERLLSMTGGLLVYESESQHVRLVHETLQAYLHGAKGAALLNTHLSVAEVLEAYLCFGVFDSQLPVSTASSWADISSLCRTHRLLDYAMRDWGYHVCKAKFRATSVGLKIAERIAGSPILVALIKFLGLLPHPLIDGEGFLTIHVAALLQCPPVVLHCVQKHLAVAEHSYSSLDKPNSMGLTPLHLASMVDNLEAVQDLVKHGASVAAKDRNDRTCVYWAAYCASTKVLQYLLTREEVSQLDLLNVADVDRVTPLHIAIRRGHAKVAETLVNGGAVQNNLTSAEQTPLHYAVQHLPQLTGLLLRGGTHIEQASNNGRTCLAWACVLGDESCLRILLEGGAKIQVKDKEGATPLHILMESTRDPVGATKLLLHYGANPYTQDNAGQTPILIALRQKRFLAAECLLSQQATPSQDCDAKILLLREASHQSDCPEVIWNQLGDVNVQNDCGQSALHLAAIDQKVTQIRNLHDHGADLELRDMTGQCPLQIAVRHSVKRRHVSHIKHSEGDVVSALLARGASVLSQAYSVIFLLRHAILTWIGGG